MAKEIWKDIKDYEGLYQVSNLGNVKSLKFRNKMTIFERERLLTPKNNKGYLRVRLSKNNKQRTYSIHRLVANSFIPNNENKPCVNHINGNKKDNRPENLEWCSYSENEQHSRKVLGKIPINRKKVNKYDLNGNFIAQYNSIAEASESIGRSYSLISSCCNKHIKKAYGYKWEFAKEVD